MNSRPAVGSESCGPMIIVSKGREDAPLREQASDRQCLLLLLLLMPSSPRGRSCQHARAIRRGEGGSGVLSLLLLLMPPLLSRLLSTFRC